jgi:hypothetical protein
MRYELVKAIIDCWDPVDLLSFAPKDEYDPISETISNMISQNDTVESIGNVIHKVFLESFGKITFEKSKDDCIEVAKQISEKFRE